MTTLIVECINQVHLHNSSAPVPPLHVETHSFNTGARLPSATRTPAAPAPPARGQHVRPCTVPPEVRGRPAPPGVPRAAHVTPPPAIGRAGGAGPPRRQPEERGFSRLRTVSRAAGRSALRAERQAGQAWALRTRGERPPESARRQECASRGSRCAGPSLSRDQGVRSAGHLEGAGSRRPRLLRSRGRGRSQRGLPLKGLSREGLGRGVGHPSN